MPTTNLLMKRSAADPIYQDLRATILERKMVSEEPLRQEEIARKYGVSKIPVREALRRLEVEGLVIFRRNRGAFVRQFSADEILNLLDVRVALECRALELAIPNIIVADIHAMRDLLEEYSRETKLEHWSELNLRFHNMLYEPCGNPVLLAMIADLQDKIGFYLRLMVTQATGFDRPMCEHEEILVACADGQIGSAVGVLRVHIETTKKEVAAHMRRSNLPTGNPSLIKGEKL